MTTITVTTSYPDLGDDTEIDHAATNARYEQTLYAALRDQFKCDDVYLTCTQGGLYNTIVGVSPEPDDISDWVASARHVVGTHYEHAEGWVVLNK